MAVLCAAPGTLPLWWPGLSLEDPQHDLPALPRRLAPGKRRSRFLEREHRVDRGPQTSVADDAADLGELRPVGLHHEVGGVDLRRRLLRDRNDRPAPTQDR